ncbi:MAG: LysR family transcriptional regulator [Gammaproteobacteria bacterium]
MDITLLKTFLEVVRARHFGRAADVLCVTQSAVSARIKLLEQSLGVELLSRKRNDIHLTPAGERLHRHADILVKGWERARLDVALREEHRHVLSAGGPYDLWRILLDRWAARVGAVHPEFALTLEANTTDILVRRVTENLLDLVVLFEAPQIEGLALRAVARIPVILVSTTAGQSLEKALRDRYVMVDWGTSFAVQHARMFPDAPAPGLRVNLGLLAFETLLARGGSAYLAEGMVRSALDAGTLHRVEGAPVFERRATAVYRPDSPRVGTISQALSVFEGLG